MTTQSDTCLSCGSKGFAASRQLGLCTFCDGSFGGHPPTDQEVEEWNTQVIKSIEQSIALTMQVLVECVAQCIEQRLEAFKGRLEQYGDVLQHDPPEDTPVFNKTLSH